jgi:hypothetical protein
MNNNKNSTNTFPNSRHGPYGHNDNNQGRQNVPSNIFPKNGGMQGNQFDRFNPISTNTQKNMNNLPSMTNFNKSFQTNAPMIEPMDYTNYGNLLHNNMGNIVIDEHIVEYRINIDSVDRDISVYNDPFSFTVKFNPPSSQTIETEVPIDPRNKRKGTKFVKTIMKGPPKPHINREFKNVKYIKLDNIVLPQFSNIVEDPENPNEYIFDNENFLVDDRFILLRIKELDSDKGQRTYDTGDGSLRYDSNGGTNSYHKPFGMILPDKLLGKNYYSGTPYYASKIYKNSTLGNLNQLTIEFYDSCGTKLKFNNLFSAKEIDTCEQDDEFPRSDIRHPLNKKIQTHLSLIIGVVESQHNTNTKFEH